MKNTPPELPLCREKTEGKRSKVEVLHFPYTVFYFLAFSLLPVSAGAEINSAFTVPPYALHETIVGIEGWEMRHKEPHPVFTDPQAALVEDSSIVNTSQPTALNLKTLVRNSQIENLGDRYVVEAQFAINFNPPFTAMSSFDGGLYFRLAGSDAMSPLIFGFDYGDDGGLYFQGQGKKTILLPKADIQEYVAYRFTVQISMDSLTFRVAVVSAYDESFRYESEDIPFQEGFTREDGKFHKIDGLHMGNNKPHALGASIDYVKAAALWE